MDLSKYNPTKAADSAQRFELFNHFDGKVIREDDGTPILDEEGKQQKDENGKVLREDNGTPLAYWILGMQSTVAKNEDAKMKRNAPKPLDKDATDEQKAEHEEQSLEYARRAGAEKLAAMVTKLEGNWQFGAKKLKASDKEMLASVIASEDWLATQFFMHSRDLKNYRPKM